MRRLVNHRVLMAALVVGLVVLIPAVAGAAAGLNRVGPTPAKVETAPGIWIDEITNLVRDHKELAWFEGRDRPYEAYLGQLAIVRMAFNSGDREATYVAMNELMDMLEADAKGGGIPIWSAKAIFDFCGRVTPVKYHDAARHNPVLGKGGFDYWADEIPDFGGGG